VTAEVGHEASSIFEALTGDLDGPVKVGDLDFEIRRGNVDVSDASKPWIPSSPAGDAWLAGVGRATALQFGDVSKLKVGVKTTADSVFISDRWAYEDPTPDRELLLPLITHHVANRWTAGPTTSRILYPYDLQAEKRTPLDMADYPKTAEYLETHRARLEGRKYVSDGGRQWWEIWVPQSPSAWALPKIVWPDISERPKFFLDTSGAVVNGDCYWMTVEDQDLALLMLAVANSDLGISYYDAVCGNKLYAGRRRFMTQYVRGFPLPNRTHPAVVELIPKVRELVSGAASERTAELESDVSRLVAQSFGVE
jgi:adenine-specific DNA-methyltransferase